MLVQSADYHHWAAYRPFGSAFHTWYRICIIHIHMHLACIYIISPDHNLYILDFITYCMHTYSMNLYKIVKAIPFYWYQGGQPTWKVSIDISSPWYKHPWVNISAVNLSAIHYMVYVHRLQQPLKYTESREQTNMDKYRRVLRIYAPPRSSTTITAHDREGTLDQRTYVAVNKSNQEDVSATGLHQLLKTEMAKAFMTDVSWSWVIVCYLFIALKFSLFHWP